MPDEPVKVTGEWSEPPSTESTSPRPASEPAGSGASESGARSSAESGSAESTRADLTEVTGERAVTPAEGALVAELASLWAPRRPKVVIKADLLPAVSVLSLVALLGVPIAWLWSRLAPPQLMRMYSANQTAPLPLESYHSFDDFGIFALMSLGVGLLTGFVVWRMRKRRGPVIMIATVLGSAVAAWLAIKMGVSFASGHYPATTPKVGGTFVQPPELDSNWLILIEPLAAALAYGAAAAWCGLEDLGRRR